MCKQNKKIFIQVGSVSPYWWFITSLMVQFHEQKLEKTSFASWTIVKFQLLLYIIKRKISELKKKKDVHCALASWIKNYFRWQWQKYEDKAKSGLLEQKSLFFLPKGSPKRRIVATPLAFQIASPLFKISYTQWSLRSFWPRKAALTFFQRLSLGL